VDEALTLPIPEARRNLPITQLSSSMTQTTRGEGGPRLCGTNRAAKTNLYDAEVEAKKRKEKRALKVGYV